MPIIGHNVNVMNHKGVIIGSGSADRIDQLHEGALQVINAGAEIDFDTHEAQHLLGVKGGINIPIRSDGQIIGVVLCQQCRLCKNRRGASCSPQHIALSVREDQRYFGCGSEKHAGRVSYLHGNASQ